MFLVLPICHENEQMLFFSYHDDIIVKPLFHCIWILFIRICFVLILTRLMPRQNKNKKTLANKIQYSAITG